MAESLERRRQVSEEQVRALERANENLSAEASQQEANVRRLRDQAEEMRKRHEMEKRVSGLGKQKTGERSMRWNAGFM